MTDSKKSSKRSSRHVCVQQKAMGESRLECCRVDCKGLKGG